MAKWEEGKDNRDYEGERSGGDLPFVLFIGGLTGTAIVGRVLWLTLEAAGLLKDLGFPIEPAIDEPDQR